jgi:hydrogenase maturation protein HypF
VADLAGYARVGHLLPVPMPGGAAAVRAPWRMAAAYLQAAYDDRVPTDLPVSRQPAGHWDAVLSMARAGVNSPLTSSAGRLFDAVAALVGVGDRVNYEGQAAVALEQLVSPHEGAAYPMRVDRGDLLRLHGRDLVRAVVDDLRAGADRSVIAARFHHGLAAALVRAVQLVREATGHSTVALSGGVFQNVVLLNEVAGLLEAHGFRVLTHRRVPTNDGGISLGQAVVAGALGRAV